MKHVICLSVWIVTFLIGGALFWTSNKVQETETENARLMSGIAESQENMAILTAEWHYLNNPAYLEKLTKVAFNEEEGVAAPLLLADSRSLPEKEVILLPTRKPSVPESFKKAQPVLVAEAKTRQSKQTSLKAPAHHKKQAPSPKTQREFSMVLASWTQ